jgi:nucleotidyltransferase substrate binding protein (TIGR01987 family)
MKHSRTKINNFREAVLRLNEALAEPDSNKLKVDGCVQRFEFTYETCKKILESALLDLGFSIENNPRETIKEAGLQGFITSLELWDKMREDRNDTSHEYNNKKAAEIYSRIPAYAAEFKLVLEKLTTNTNN